MQNLISNALKFHGQNSPAVKIYSQTLGINSVCQILVEDQGIGFDEKYLERIFRPTVVLLSSSKRQIKHFTKQKHKVAIATV